MFLKEETHYIKEEREEDWQTDSQSESLREAEVEFWERSGEWVERQKSIPQTKEEKDDNFALGLNHV